MDEPTAASPARRDAAEQPAPEPMPRAVAFFSTRFGRRHVRGVAIVRWLVAIWLVVLGSIFCATGHWWGASLFVVAGLVGWLAFEMPRWKPVFDTWQNGPRVRELERTRALVVDDAVARLRRIEQDLHDGAQAQMVAVVMKLGLARDRLEGALAGSGQHDLERAVELIGAAHQGAMDAISELRDLARGIHPPALDEGLNAALATLAARSELPVEVEVDLCERPSAAIETIAYFCVAELLTNVAKHSGATRAKLQASQQPGVVLLRVCDDGTGGAHIEADGGLAGLTERVKTVDGRLTLTSPIGGPTAVTVELPSHA